MDRAWVTTSSNRVVGLVNTLNAACEEAEYVPDALYFLETPGVEDVVADAADHAATVVEAYSGTEPAVELTAVPAETAFDDIWTHVEDAVAETRAAGGEVAVDITPGRKYMSAIAFAAGARCDADHVYYLHMVGEHYGKAYPDVPRTSTTLYDFTEEL